MFRIRQLQVGILVTAMLYAFAERVVADGDASIIPWTESKPVIDAVFTDACWNAALTLTNFCRPNSSTPATQATEVKVCYNSRTLFLAVTCHEANTNTIVAQRPEEDDHIWQDDSFEIWLRDPTDNARFDQFIASSLGVRESRLKPLPDGTKIRPQWRVAATLVEGAWVAELAIPFSDLGREVGPVPGELLQVKFGREDYTKRVKGVDWGIWPPNVPYGPRGDVGLLHFGRVGFLRNPDLVSTNSSEIPGWGGNQFAGLLQSVEEEGERVVLFQTPGRYATFEQIVFLPRNRLFSLSCEIKGSAGGYLRARTGNETRGVVTDRIRPSSEWQSHEVLFQTDPSGRATVLVGTTPDDEPGLMRLRGLHVEEVLMRDFLGNAIPVNPEDDREMVIKALRPTDSRILRGLCTAPIDGTTHSWDFAGRLWEYNMPGSGPGIQFNYHKNDGLHITLEDARGVNAIQVRGGVHARVLTDCTRYDDPASGTEQFVFDGRAHNSMEYSRKPIKSAKFSFFDVGDGTISDVGFFRTGERMPKVERVLELGLLEGDVPEAVGAQRNARFGKYARTTYPLRELRRKEGGTFSGRVDRISFRTAVHLVKGPLESEFPVGAIGIRGNWEGGVPGTLLTIQVQDSVHPFSAVATATVSLNSKGDLNLVLDFPDQVVQPGQSFWVSLIPQGNVTIRDMQVDLYQPSRAEAVSEALPLQLLKFRGFYVSASESRPWNTLRYRSDLNTVWKESFSGDQWRVFEPFVNGLLHCRILDPNDPVSTQYERWFYRAADKRAGRPVLNDPELPEDEGAPRWAVVTRAAWMQTRSVAAWWMRNRSVPTGEFGTEVNDDTDLYQNFSNFPMFERDGVGGEVVDGAQRLWNLMMTGGYIEDGLNAWQDDALHAYEEGINHEAMMLWWMYGDPIYMEACITAARSTEALTTINKAGHRHFISTIVSSADLRNRRADEEDGGCHGLLLHPTAEVVWYNRNPRALKFLTEYCDAWLAHMQTPGKYATSVDTETDEVLRTEPEPFRESMSYQFGVMLTAADAHEDDRFIKPALDYFQTNGPLDYLTGYLTDLYDAGYLDKLQNCRDYLFDNDHVIRWRETGDKDAILQELETEIAETQTYPIMYTTSEPFSDRVFLNHGLKLTSSSIAYTGGYAARNKGYQSHAVSWDGFGTNYAALVRTARRDHFQALVYNFREAPLSGTARFWTLRHGLYDLEIGQDQDGDDQIDVGLFTNTMEVVRGDAVNLVLPPRQVTVINLKLRTPLDRITERADLALSATELTVVGETVRGVAHNIGSSSVSNVVVALVDAQGMVRSAESLGVLPAPLDLIPKRLEFTLSGLPEAHADWHVVLDPEKVVDEITERNNAISLP